MKITITSFGNQYEWDLYDGPDGIDHFFGIADNLAVCFEDIQRVRTLNSLRYKEESQSLQDVVAGALMHYSVEDV